MLGWATRVGQYLIEREREKTSIEDDHSSFARNHVDYNIFEDLFFVNLRSSLLSLKDDKYSCFYKKKDQLQPFLSCR